MARIYFVRPSNPDDVAPYEQNLRPQDEAEKLACNARSIIYSPTIVAGVIACQLKRFALNQRLYPQVFPDAGTALIN